MKYIILIAVIVLSTHITYGQQIDKKEIDNLKAFYLNSPIHDSLEISLFNYKNGNSDYYPIGKYVPWGSYYMPLKYGGLATRWKISEQSYPTSKTLYTWADIKKMSIEQIAKLSPAEKMDIYLGDTSFVITKNELKYRGPERDSVPKGWEGFCNGMRAAGALLPEPEHEIIVRTKCITDTVTHNFDSIYIKFYPADLKALAGANNYWVDWVLTLGENNKIIPNAGLFDIVLRDALGRQKRTFFIDVMPGDQKWNESIVGYKRRIINEQTVNQSSIYPNGTTKSINIDLTLYQLDEQKLSDEPTVPKIQNHQLTTTWIANYKLFVNSSNQIVGGRWEKYYKLNEPEKFITGPDYMWLAAGSGTDDVHKLPDAGNPFLHFSDIEKLILYSVK
jgi:hypothetical protein